jgi:hypothetical protein
MRHNDQGATMRRCIAVVGLAVGLAGCMLTDTPTAPPRVCTVPIEAQGTWTDAGYVVTAAYCAPQGH